jgi:hypothetical protein
MAGFTTLYTLHSALSLASDSASQNPLFCVITCTFFAYFTENAGYYSRCWSFLRPQRVCYSLWLNRSLTHTKDIIRGDANRRVWETFWMSKVLTFYAEVNAFLIWVTSYWMNAMSTKGSVAFFVTFGKPVTISLVMITTFCCSHK